MLNRFDSSIHQLLISLNQYQLMYFISVRNQTLLKSTDSQTKLSEPSRMGKTKLIEYIVINESLYQGEGHIINIAKRHTNRRWRQYTP